MALAARAAVQMSEDDLAPGQTAGIGGRLQAITRSSLFSNLNIHLAIERLSMAPQRVVARARSVPVSIANDIVRGIRAYREQAQQVEALRLEAVARSRQRDEQAAAERAAQAKVDATPLTSADVATSTPAQARRLDGAAMRKSTFPTWLMLVGFGLGFIAVGCVDFPTFWHRPGNVGHVCGRHDCSSALGHDLRVRRHGQRAPARCGLSVSHLCQSSIHWPNERLLS